MDGAGDLRAAFLEGMSRAAATVNIVTTDGPGGRAGATVSAMASVSADEGPTLLVCLHHASPAAEAVLANGAFAVNVLRDDQSWLSDVFAGRRGHEGAAKFGATDWVDLGTGAPGLADTLVTFDCRVAEAQRVGTHHVVFGTVADVRVSERGSPLIYAGRSYGRAAPVEPVTSRVGGAVLRLGCFHTVGPGLLPDLLARWAPGGGGLHLVEGDHRRICESLVAGETDLALVYDFDLPAGVRADLLAELPPYVLLPADHRLAALDRVSLEALAPEPMVLLDAPPSGAYFTGLFADQGLAPQVVWRSSSLEMVRGLVARGLGYALLGTRPASDLSYAGRALVARPLVDAVEPSRLVLAAREGALPTEAESFALICREHFDLDL